MFQDKARENRTGKKSSTAKLRHQAEETTIGLHALMAAAEQAAQNVVTGEHAQKKPGMGEKFWQFREYDPGDRPQDIDWRQSAKGDRLYVRQKEWQSTQISLFWCQNNGAMDYSAFAKRLSKGETARILTLAMAILMTRGGEQVRMLEGAKRAGKSDLVLHKIGESLLKQKTKALPSTDIVSFPTKSFLALTGDFLAPPEDIERNFAALAKRTDSALVIQVMDPAEIELPFDGRIIFENHDTKHEVKINNVESIRADYMEKIQAHREFLKSLCKKYRWGYLLHTTDMNIRTSLFEAWHMLAPEKYSGES